MLRRYLFSLLAACLLALPCFAQAPATTPLPIDELSELGTGSQIPPVALLELGLAPAGRAGAPSATSRELASLPGNEPPRPLEGRALAAEEELISGATPQWKRYRSLLELRLGSAKIAELEPGIYYVDIDRITDEDFYTAVDALAADDGVIFDLRGYPDGRAISYAETYMGIVEANGLAEIVGSPTAGTNGNVNVSFVPGGNRVPHPDPMGAHPTVEV